MDSLRAFILFSVVAVSAFLADQHCFRDAAIPTYGLKATVRKPGPEESEILATEKKRPSQKRRSHVTLIVKATAYNAVPEQTDSTPEICAWGDRVRPGIIAISRDLEGLGLTRGKEVQIEGLGKRTVMDRMHSRKRNQIDLYMEKYEDAVQFGVQDLTIYWTEEENPEQEG
jgi:3D (Asp-Asp-Asp) domain-containing protein